MRESPLAASHHGGTADPKKVSQEGFTDEPERLCHAFVHPVSYSNLHICLSLFLQHLCAEEIPDDAPKLLTQR